MRQGRTKEREGEGGLRAPRDDESETGELSRVEPCAIVASSRCIRFVSVRSASSAPIASLEFGARRSAHATSLLETHLIKPRMLLERISCPIINLGREL